MSLKGPKSTQTKQGLAAPASEKGSLRHPSAAGADISTQVDYSATVFDGDGRRNVDPVHVPAGSNPVPVTGAIAKGMIQRFLASGTSVHSARGETLWVPVAYCIQKNLDFAVRGSSTDGFVVELTGPQRDQHPSS